VGDLMPLNTAGLPDENRRPVPGDQLFLGGDIRANENIEPTAVHVLYLREHNRQAAEIAAANPGLGDGEIYQRARRVVGAELQATVYNEWRPALLGPDALRPYTGYSPAVIDPWVGGLAEDRAPGSSVGPLFRRVTADRLERVRDGDRFWYQRKCGPLRPSGCGCWPARRPTTCSRTTSSWAAARSSAGAKADPAGASPAVVARSSDGRWRRSAAAIPVRNKE
jgi:hypothetical protein